MITKGNVQMITRHRQWRAWQYGRRHSGLFGGGGSSDGDDNGIFDFDGFRKLPWWGRILFIVTSLSVIILCMAIYYQFMLASWAAVLVADNILDIILPDKEGEDYNSFKNKKWNVIVSTFLLTVFLLLALVPKVGETILIILIVYSVGRWLFAG